MVLDALALEVEILKHIPHTALESRPPLPQGRSSAPDVDALSYACAFYDIQLDDIALLTATKRSSIPFISAFEDSICLSTLAASGQTFFQSIQ